MVTVFDVADYFLAKTDPDVGDHMTHLKLQKMVFFAQGAHLAIYGQPLFAEDIVAWEHGPVCPVLYRRYKAYGAEPIEPTKSIQDVARSFTVEQMQLLDDVNETYGCFTASALRRLSHETPPWQKAFPDGSIGHESMRSYFKTQLVD